MNIIFTGIVGSRLTGIYLDNEQWWDIEIWRGTEETGTKGWCHCYNEQWNKSNQWEMGLSPERHNFLVMPTDKEEAEKIFTECVKQLI